MRRRLNILLHKLAPFAVFFTATGIKVLAHDLIVGRSEQVFYLLHFCRGKSNGLGGQIAFFIDIKISNQIKKLPEFKELLSLDVQLNKHLAHYFCALREAYEETGVLIDCENYNFLSNDGSKLRKLSDYPSVNKIKLIARAITPPHSKIRFDNKFFLVNSKHITNYSRINSNELLDIDWYDLDKAMSLDIPHI